MFSQKEKHFFYGVLAGIGTVQLIHLFWQAAHYFFKNSSYGLLYFIETLIVLIVGLILWKNTDLSKPFSNGYILIIVGSAIVYLILIGQSFL